MCNNLCITLLISTRHQHHHRHITIPLAYLLRPNLLRHLQAAITSSLSQTILKHYLVSLYDAFPRNSEPTQRVSNQAVSAGVVNHEFRLEFLHCGGHGGVDVGEEFLVSGSGVDIDIIGYCLFGFQVTRVDSVIVSIDYVGILVIEMVSLVPITLVSI